MLNNGASLVGARENGKGRKKRHLRRRHYLAEAPTAGDGKTLASVASNFSIVNGLARNSRAPAVIADFFCASVTKPVTIMIFTSGLRRRRASVVATPLIIGIIISVITAAISVFR